MSSRVLKHVKFLRSLIDNPLAISTATTAQIGCVVELCLNISKIPFTRDERQKLVRYLPIILHIGRIRRFNKAREVLIEFAPFILPVLVPAALEFIKK